MIKLLSSIIDTLLAVVKWPVAALAVLILPFALIEADIPFLWTSLLGDGRPFLYGFVPCLVLSFLAVSWFRDSFFSTFEHELTHAVFAWLCFHKVTRFEASDGRNSSSDSENQNRLGAVWHTGNNWLISIAPYFSPTFLLPFYLVALLNPPPVFLVLVGMICAYHITSTYRETGLHQTDLKKVGYLFSFMFLPAANLIIYVASIYYFVYSHELAWQYINNTFLASYEFYSQFFP
jgi:hypothetical protein